MLTCSMNFIGTWASLLLFTLTVLINSNSSWLFYWVFIMSNFKFIIKLFFKKFIMQKSFFHRFPTTQILEYSKEIDTCTPLHASSPSITWKSIFIHLLFSKVSHFSIYVGSCKNPLNARKQSRASYSKPTFILPIFWNFLISSSFKFFKIFEFLILKKLKIFHFFYIRNVLKV